MAGPKIVDEAIAKLLDMLYNLTPGILQGGDANAKQD